ncbi:putative mitochondrial cryptochrome DASH precursor [Cercophora samala]|uniref:Cryptochrome DASH n=1 Tax=Cercophora samala TaxID=330535 RepID=A0AA39ZCN0_9PEZI|nr:putative mitochondrial cryptochrome DASH precursor [Cercophora samala]
MAAPNAPQNVLIHIIRRDLRLSDNPLFHAAAIAPDEERFDAHLPLYVFDAQHVDVSGFLQFEGASNPHKPPRSQVAGYHRCGPHRAKFLAEAVWDLSESLNEVGSGLFIRVGRIPDVVETLLSELAKKGAKVGAVWMTGHEGSEEKADEKAVASLCDSIGAKWKLWVDEKYFIHDHDTGLESIDKLPDIFTSYRKMQEPLREKPRPVLPSIEQGQLPPLVDAALVAPQPAPFRIPDTLERLVESLVAPVKNFLPNKPGFPEGAESAHPYKGGETVALQRLFDFIASGAANTYNNTRNDLLGTEFSTKLSAFLAQGCITARQIHKAMDSFERGTDPSFKDVEGFGVLSDKKDMSEDKTENAGMQFIRTELLWRDYMRLCHQKFGNKFFRLSGTQSYDRDDAASGSGSGSDGSTQRKRWKSPVKERALAQQSPTAEEVAEMLERFNEGTTGMGLIDASQRELLHTGYTSNRARQNVASFLSKHLYIDWRYGAEWYEMLLVDYDVSSNWANWQYVSGVGNDPRGEIRIFNPIKQAFDYDPEGKYVRAWVPEVSGLKKLENVFQPWTASKEDLEEVGLSDHVMVTKPVKRIEFYVGSKPRTNKRGGIRRGTRRGNPFKPPLSQYYGNDNSQPARENGKANGNANGNVNGNTQNTRVDSPVVNGTTRGPPGTGHHGRGSFNGVGRFNNNASFSPVANQGNDSGHLVPVNGSGSRPRGGSQRAGRGSYRNRGGQYGALQRGRGRGGGHNGNYTNGNHVTSAVKQLPDEGN